MNNKEFCVMFWRDHPEFMEHHRVKKSQNDYHADIRLNFCDYLYHSDLTEKQKQNYTLIPTLKKEIRR